MECGGADTALDWIATGRTRLPWPCSIQSGVSILLRQGFAGFRHAHSIKPSCVVCDATSRRRRHDSDPCRLATAFHVRRFHPLRQLALLPRLKTAPSILNDIVAPCRVSPSQAYFRD